MVNVEGLAEYMVDFMSEENARQLPWGDLDEGAQSLYVDALEATLDEAGVDLG